MENSDSIFAFLNMIGAVLGPVGGVMIAQYFFVLKEKLNLDELYMDPKQIIQTINIKASIKKPILQPSLR